MIIGITSFLEGMYLLFFKICFRNCGIVFRFVEPHSQSLELHSQSLELYPEFEICIPPSKFIFRIENLYSTLENAIPLVRLSLQKL